MIFADYFFCPLLLILLLLIFKAKLNRQAEVPLSVFTGCLYLYTPDLTLKHRAIWLDVRKSVFGFCDHVGHNPACSDTETN